MKSSFFPWIFMVGLLSSWGVATTACRDSGNVDNTCESDDDCSLPGTRCDVAQNQCICATDEACREGEFCNRAGVCQVRAGCSRNEDCTQDGTFCDIASGQCLSGPSQALGSACGLASHCPFGSICQFSEAQPDQGTCVEGCFGDGDCPLGDVCVDGQCQSGTGLCSNDGFCGFTERCIDAQCREDFRGPYCRGCTPRTGLNPAPCDDARNFCLLNNLELGGFTQFCGVDCSLGQACPNGYGCADVVILTEQVCQGSAQCQCESGDLQLTTTTCTVAVTCNPLRPDGTPDPDAPACAFDGFEDCNDGTTGGDGICVVPRGQTLGSCTCRTDDDCADGRTCTSGLCCAGEVSPDSQCSVGEGRISGFCSCATDDDCPRDSCNGSSGTCSITGLPCTPGNNDCGNIPCVDGGCLIGQNCAPEQGLTCSTLRGG